MIRRAAAVLSATACLLALAAVAKPKPPSCTNCPATIQVGGITCTLAACGFDCVYTCPFPR